MTRISYRRLIYPAILFIFISMLIIIFVSIKLRGKASPSKSWYAENQTCQISHLYLSRPTGISYQHGKLFLLGRSYEKFYSIDLMQPHCRVHPITGGRSKGFVVPLSMYYYQAHQAWYVVDPATGIIVIKKDGTSHGLNVEDPVTKNTIDPSNGFAKIDSDDVAVVDLVANKITKINLAHKTAQVISSNTRGHGPDMQAPIGITFIGQSLYVLDYKLKSIFKINPVTGDRSIFMKLTSLSSDQLKAQQPFILSSLYLGKTPFLLVSDPQKKTIFKINIAQHSLSVLTSNSSIYGPKWLAPFGMAFDHKNTLFVTDYAGNAVYAVNMTTGKKRKLLSIKNPTQTPHLVYPGQIMMSSRGQLIIGDERLPGIIRVNPLTGHMSVITSPVYGSGPIMLEAIAVNTLKHGKFIFSDTVLAQFFSVDAHGNRHVLHMMPSKAPKLMDPWALIKDPRHAGHWYITDGGGGSGNVFSAIINAKKNTIKRKLITSNKNYPGPKLDNTLGLVVLPDNQLVVANSMLWKPTLANRNLIAINPATGKRTLFSGSVDGITVGKGTAFKSVTWLLLGRHNHLYVSDSRAPAIFLVNTKTGDRQYVIKGKPFKIIAGFALSLDKKTMYINDVGEHAIYALNLKNKTTRLLVKSK